MAATDGRRRFADRVVIVTGGGAGLGRAYSQGFAREGAKVVVADIDGAGAQAVAKEIGGLGGTAIPVEVDVADEGSVAAMVREVDATFGGVDVLVNNAGLHLGKYNECTTLPVADWERIFAVNVLAAMICARECRAAMAARGGGVILNQASTAAYSDRAGAYGVTKLALTGLTVQLATELAPDDIRVVAVAPGMFASDAVIERLEPEHKQFVLDQQLVKRIGTPDDLVGIVLFLCSDEAAFANSQTYVLDGGFTKRI